MDTIQDILQAIGLGLAFGLRPVLAPLVIAICASANFAVDFSNTPLDWVESTPFLIFLVAFAIAGLIDSGRSAKGNGVADELWLGAALVFGGIFGAGSLAEHDGSWILGAAIGAGAAALGWYSTASLIAGTRKRLQGEAEASLILPAIVEFVAVLTAFLSVIFPWLAIIALVAVLVLFVRGRQTGDGGRYAGLRTLSK